MAVYRSLLHVSRVYSRNLLEIIAAGVIARTRTHTHADERGRLSRERRRVLLW
jgi:hypothetical protein